MNSERGRNWMQIAVFLTLAIIVMNSIYEVISDGDETHSHAQFFSEMRDFKLNYRAHSIQHGFDLCERINKIDEAQVDCEKIYFDETE